MPYLFIKVAVEHVAPPVVAAVGPARSTLITFVNPAVAVTVGAVLLGEAITAATIGGFVLVLSGCWLATRTVAAMVPESPVLAEPALD